MTSSRARSTRSKSTAWLHEGWGAREIADTIVEIDLTAADALGELHDELEREGIVFALARVKQDLRAQLERIGLITHIGPERLYATLPVALAAFAARNEHRQDETGPAG